MLKHNLLLIVLLFSIFMNQAMEIRKKIEPLELPTEISVVFDQTDSLRQLLLNLSVLKIRVSQALKLTQKLQMARDTLSVLESDKTRYSEKESHSQLCILFNQISNNVDRLSKIDQDFPDAGSNQEYDWNNEQENFAKVNKILIGAYQSYIVNILAYNVGEEMLNSAYQVFGNIMKNSYRNSDRVYIQRFITILSNHQFTGCPKDRFDKSIKVATRLSGFIKVLNQYPDIINTLHQGISAGYLPKTYIYDCPTHIGLEAWLSQQRVAVNTVIESYKLQANQALVGMRASKKDTKTKKMKLQKNKK